MSESIIHDLSKIQILTSQVSLGDFIKNIKENKVHFSIQLYPWNNVLISRLIESIFIRFPISPFYFEVNNDEYTVIDGNQRLNAIKRFVIDMDIELVGLEYLTYLNGKRHSCLARSEQRTINEFPILTYVIMPNNMSKDMRASIFKRFNPKF